VKLRASFALFRCGRCNRTYANPLGHMCVVRMDRKSPVRKTTVAPKADLSAGCGTCGKPMGNPLTHVCVIRSDFKKRKAAAAKRTAVKPRHLYQSCRDDDCQRVPCTAFRDGRAEGYQDGYSDGEAAGYRAGQASMAPAEGG